MDSSNFSKLNTIVFYSSNGDGALAVIRLLGPARQLGFRVIKGVENGIVQVESVRVGDIVVLQRDFCRDLDSYEKIISLAHSLHIPVILDLDDLLFELPENHPDRLSGYYVDALLPMLQAVMEVDLVMVATDALRDYLLPYNKKIKVVPNFLDDSIWAIKEPSTPKVDEEVVTIGYMGGPSHKPDLLLVLPVLLKLIEKYPNKLRFQFWGIEPPIELLPFSHVDWCPPKSFEYAKFAEYFQLQTADIMIAPLCDNLFNSCKSSIKFLEYSAIGVPGVYSRVKPYSEIITDGIEGLLASNADEWESSLSKLIENQDLRRTLVQCAQQKIKQNWLLSQNAKVYLQAYSDLILNYQILDRTHPPFYQLGKILARQYYVKNKNLKIQTLEGLVADQEQAVQALTGQVAEREQAVQALTGQVAEREQAVQALTGQVAEQEQAVQVLTGQVAEREQAVQVLTGQVAEREQEILMYAQSKSWRLTRPLRKLIQILKSVKQ